MNGEQRRTGTVTARYHTIWNQWRWHCSICNETHGTAGGERDYDGPVLDAIHTHIDNCHPNDDVTIEIKNADGDIDDDEKDQWLLE